MTANGQPDNPRSARYILKDFVIGKLLYCHAPPNVKQNNYHKWPERKKTTLRVFTPREARVVKVCVFSFLFSVSFFACSTRI